MGVWIIPKRCPDVAGMGVRMRPKYATGDARSEIEVIKIKSVICACRTIEDEIEYVLNESKLVLRKLVNGEWDESFQVVPPGSEIKLWDLK